MRSMVEGPLHHAAHGPPPLEIEGRNVEVKAAFLEVAGQPLVIGEAHLDAPGPHEVRIRTAACGLCHSDLHFIDGAYPHPMPCIPGHEAAGIVEAVGSEVRTVKPGDAVVTCLTAY